MLRLDGDNKTKMTNVITLQPMAICSITSRYCVDTLSGRRLCRFRPVGIVSNPMTAPNLRASQTCFFFFLFVAVALLRFGPTKKFWGGRAQRSAKPRENWTGVASVGQMPLRWLIGPFTAAQSGGQTQTSGLCLPFQLKLLGPPADAAGASSETIRWRAGSRQSETNGIKISLAADRHPPEGHLHQSMGNASASRLAWPTLMR